MEDTTELKIVESIRDHVYMLRGEQVMIDSDLRHMAIRWRMVSLS